MKTVQVRVLIALALLAMVPVSGCHTGLNEVTGKVTLDGRTVPGMEVRFEPKDPNIGTTAIGYTQADGSYTLHYPGDKTGVRLASIPSPSRVATGRTKGASPFASRRSTTRHRNSRRS